MTEKSILWTTNGTGDGTSGGFTMADMVSWLRRTFVSDNPATQGVLVGYNNALAVSGTSSPVSVATGGAVVYGYPYENDAALNVTIPTPSASTRIDRIVLRASWSAQTVRITRIAGTEGAGAPALVQTPGTTYDLPLAQASITTGGVITVTDGRAYAHFATRVGAENLDDDAVTVDKIGAGAVDATALGTGAVTETKISAGAVVEAKITDGSVTVNKLGAGAVATAKIADNAVDDTKAGSRVPRALARQGGSATDWNVAGTTYYTPDGVMIQCGNAVGTEAISVTFPIAFSAKPVVIMQQEGASWRTAHITTTTASGFGAQIIEHYGSSPYHRINTDPAITFNWMAIGPYAV